MSSTGRVARGDVGRAHVVLRGAWSWLTAARVDSLFNLAGVHVIEVAWRLPAGRPRRCNPEMTCQLLLQSRRRASGESDRWGQQAWRRVESRTNRHPINRQLALPRGSTQPANVRAS